MGSICCCPCVDEFEEYPSNSLYGHCICLRFFFHQLFTGCSAMFYSIEGRPVSSSSQSVAVSLSGIGPAQTDNSTNDSRHSVSRPLPFDAGYTRLQRDGLVSRREKSTIHLQEDLQPLRRNVSSSGVESLGPGQKWSTGDSADDLKPDHLEPSEKMLATKAANGLFYIQTSSEDEDVCPTCLDEYTPENPKIMTRCSHHFHLGCIYEWMERSDTCPICGQEMEFCESP